MNENVKVKDTLIRIVYEILNIYVVEIKGSHVTFSKN